MLCSPVRESKSSESLAYNIAHRCWTPSSKAKPVRLQDRLQDTRAIEPRWGHLQGLTSHELLVTAAAGRAVTVPDSAKPHTPSETCSYGVANTLLHL